MSEVKRSMKPVHPYPVRLLLVLFASFSLGACGEGQGAGVAQSPTDSTSGVVESTAVAPVQSPEIESSTIGSPAVDTADAGEDESDGTAGEPSDKLALTEIYKNAEYGYSIDLPTGWVVDDAAPLVIIRSEDDSANPGSDGVPANMTKIDIVPLEGFPLDIEARVEQIRAELESISEEEFFTLIGGEQAVWLRGSGSMADDTGIVVTIVADELFQIQAYGNPRPLKAIAFTFRSAE